MDIPEKYTRLERGLVIQERFELKEKLGSGSFGVVFRCHDRKRNMDLAMKLESTYTSVPQLQYEYKVYMQLSGLKGIPKLYKYISNYVFPFGKYNILIMQLLERDLESYFNHCGYKFSVQTALQLGHQMVKLLQNVHGRDILHRDIKPDNFMMDAKGQLYIVDFGLSKRYRDPVTHIHIPYREDKRLVGTPRYASINVQLGIESSRRDDLESIYYIVMYFLRGQLPWQGMKAISKKQKYQKILETKMASPIDILCKGYPYECLVFAEYVRNLRFADKPDYDYLAKLFLDGLVRLGLPTDAIYDWNKRLPPLAVIEEEEDKASIEFHTLMPQEMEKPKSIGHSDSSSSK
jgi:casein kinase 1